MLLLINYLNAKGEATFDELCQRLGYEKNELKKVLRIINLCGLPDYTPYDLFWADVVGDRVSISFADDFKKPVQLTQREAVALIIASEVFKGTPLGSSDSLSSAIEKIERALPKELSKAVEEIKKRLDLKVEASVEEPLKVILKEAIEECESLRIVYHSHGKREYGERIIDPIRLFFSKNKWYLRAIDHKDSKSKLFIVDRIIDAKKTGKNFSFDNKALGVYEPEPHSAIWKNENARDVKLKFWGEAARLVSEIVPEKDIEWLDSENAVVKFRALDLNWILTDYVFPYADSVSIIEPEELKELVKEEVEKILEIHES